MECHEQGAVSCQRYLHSRELKQFKPTASFLLNFAYAHSSDFLASDALIARTINSSTAIGGVTQEVTHVPADPSTIAVSIDAWPVRAPFP